MLIREITEIDSISYFKLRVQSEQEFPQFVGFNAERELLAGQSGIAALLAGYVLEGTVVWGAFQDDQLIGVVVLSRQLSSKYKHKAFLWGMFVVSEFRGAGVAQALMQAAISWASAHPEVVAITLQVTLSNIRGQQFYKRLGFTIFGTEQRSLFAAGQFHGVHYMELEVKHA
jgi:RimJ/RimL family protein N-acetyltransferase